MLDTFCEFDCFFFCWLVFYSELLDTLVKAKEDNYNTENLILEINSLKWVLHLPHPCPLHWLTIQLVVNICNIQIVLPYIVDLTFPFVTTYTNPENFMKIHPDIFENSSKKKKNIYEKETVETEDLNYTILRMSAK